MRTSITIKLILSFLVVSVFSLILVGIFTRSSTSTEFQRYISTQDGSRAVEIFANYYTRNNSWDGVRDAIDERYLGLLPFVLLDMDGEILFGEQRSMMMPMHNESLPIDVAGETVGYLIMADQQHSRMMRSNGDAFLSRMDNIFKYSLVGVGVLALVLGLLLSQYLTRPIRELTAATRAVADGDLEQVVPVRSNDELGKLADSFNRMNKQLAHSLNLRRQMTADIAHELRTPLSIILGHADGIHDGVLPLSMDTVEIIRDEASRLERLVEDLRTLSRADAGELPLDLAFHAPQKLLDEIRTRYQPQAIQKEITLDITSEPNLPDLQVDFGRILQVLSNALDNALRYTPKGGQILLSAQKMPDAVELRIQDNGPGLEAEEAAHIFDRFYRADASRQRDEGGSGLGLAISKSIVEEHGGRIWAESEEGQGLTINIALPISSP